MDPFLYPGAANAVELCENLQQWDMYRQTAEVEGIASLKNRMRGSLLEAMSRSGPARVAVMKQALSEWDHPDFDRYLTEKIHSL